MTDVRMHVRLANLLRERIVAGTYGTEGRLPSVATIQKEYKASRMVVENALAFLEGERRIYQEGTTYRVSLSTIVMTQHVPSLANRLRITGKVSFTRNLAPVDSAILPDYIADILHLDHGMHVVFRYRIGGELVNGMEKPSRLLKFYYLMPITTNQLEHLNDNPATDILFESGPSVMTREDVLTPRHLTSEEAAHLHVPELTPVQFVRIINTSIDGRILLVQESVFVGESFTYKYSFENRPLLRKDQQS